MAAAGAAYPLLAQNVQVCTFPIPVPLKLKRNLAENWCEWRQIWESFKIVTGLNTASETIRIATFVTCIGQGALRLYNVLPFASKEDKKMDVEAVLFQQQCIGETNVIYEPFAFNCRSQEESEHFDCYSTALKEMLRRCEFREMTEQLLRDRVVCGIGDNALRKSPLQQKNLILQDC